eukprot:1634708-Pyramimonas_sp.AAC.1
MDQGPRRRFLRRRCSAGRGGPARKPEPRAAIANSSRHADASTARRGHKNKSCVERAELASS